METSEETRRTQGSAKGLLVFEGDSWFSLPYTPFRRDVVEWLDHFGYEFESVADPSHTLREMAFSPEQRNDLTRKLERVSSRKTGLNVPEAILLSGGGNDLVKRFRTLLNQAGPNTPVFRDNQVKDFIDDMKECFEEWVKFVTGECGRIFPRNGPIPILLHGYACPVPDGRGFGYGFGPWFYPFLEAKGHTDLQTNTDEMEQLVDKLNDMLLAFSTNIPHVHYVNMRRCLTNNLHHYRNDWQDELHPTHTGFENVAAEFKQKIKGLGIQSRPPQV